MACASLEMVFHLVFNQVRLNSHKLHCVHTSTARQWQWSIILKRNRVCLNRTGERRVESHFLLFSVAFFNCDSCGWKRRFNVNPFHFKDILSFYQRIQWILMNVGRIIQLNLQKIRLNYENIVVSCVFGVFLVNILNKFHSQYIMIYVSRHDSWPSPSHLYSVTWQEEIIFLHRSRIDCRDEGKKQNSGPYEAWEGEYRIQWTGQTTAVAYSYHTTIGQGVCYSIDNVLLENATSFSRWWVLLSSSFVFGNSLGF